MISIAIPVYIQSKKEITMLKRLIDSIMSQTYKDIEIVISDNTQGELGLKVEELVKRYKKIRYFYNERHGASANTNSAIMACNCDVIKIMYQDDYFTDKDALKEIIESFKGHWLINGCSDNLTPIITGDLHKGNNKLGSPSCLTIRKESFLPFDESLKWLFDCEMYKRMLDTYGEPKIMIGDYVTIGIGEHQATNKLSDELKRKEVVELSLKYK